MYEEDDLLPLSGLQHLAFCERQWALIHLEETWLENRLTVEGRHLHDRVHGAESETRGDVRVVRTLRLRSLRLGLSGQADAVEFHRQPDGSEQPFPVEYKRGRPKPTRCDEIQVCAQAMCLEEMLGVSIPEGAIYYGQPHRRHGVAFDDALRQETEAAAARMHALFAAGETPTARYEPKCDNCSLYEACLPKTAAQHKDARRYLDQMWAGLDEDMNKEEPGV